MKKKHKNSLYLPNSAGQASGFSLIELLVAMAVFLVISGAAVSLVQKHVPLASAQQNQATLNMGIRNATAQMQIDAVNAGTGYYPGANIPSFPVGVTVFNCGDLNNGCNSVTSTSNCFNATTFTYGSTCFDQLNIVAVDNSVPPAHPDSSTSCVSTTSSTLFVTPTGTTTTTQLAGAFHTGDELLLIKADGTAMTTTVLTKDGHDTGSGNVQLQHNPTGTDGSNSSDLLGIANSADAANNKLGTQFCNNDWVLKLSAIAYTVDSTTNPADPQLLRWTDFGTAGAASTVVADQVIGFKVGAMTWNTNEDENTYLFNAPQQTPQQGCTANCGYNNDFSLIRAVMVSVIGRTASSPTSTFHNSFDGGPYKVEAVSVVINPRNLSMNDQ